MAIITGIDIGTHTVRVIITESGDSGLPKILGRGMAESRGLRHGYIINVTDATKSIRAAVDEAERAANIRIRDAFISVGGVGLEGSVTQAAAIISRADSEITEHDIERALRAAEIELPQASNKRIMHTIPIEYRIDGKKVYGRPLGMKGLKLEVTALLVTSLEQHLSDLIRAVEEAGIEVLDVTASPLAASYVSLTKAQRMAGCVLANIGAETISVVVFEDGIPISLEVFPVGSTDITNDIALGLKIPLEEAEMIKLGKAGHQYPRKRLSEIVESRLDDMFELVVAHLKKIGKNELLPAGIILTGGGSGIETIEDFARGAMRLPSKIPNVSLELGPGQEGGRHATDTSWFVAYGLCIWGKSGDRGDRPMGGGALLRLQRFFREIGRQLLP